MLQYSLQSSNHSSNPRQYIDTNPNIETSEVFETDTEDLTHEKLELHRQQIELDKFRLQMEHESLAQSNRAGSHT